MNHLTSPILALDTGVGASAALLMPDGQHISASMIYARAHSRELLPLLANLLDRKSLAWADIGGFAVGTGPGSFTGLRVACATMAGINASLKQPIYQLNSLVMTAIQADVQTPVWSLEDARSGLVYTAEVTGFEVATTSKCLSWDELLAYPPADFASSSEVPVDLPGWSQIELKQCREQSLIAYALFAVLQQPTSLLPTDACLEPLYLQPSQAEKTYAENHS